LSLDIGNAGTQPPDSLADLIELAGHGEAPQ
jgi:hypothetical protein